MPTETKKEITGFDGIILWSVIGVTGFALVAGTLMHFVGAVGAEDKAWLDGVVKPVIFTGFGYIGAAFKGYFMPGGK